MALGFANLVNSPRGEVNNKPVGFEFTPIGKRHTGEFKVIHSYPETNSPKRQQPRRLFKPLRDAQRNFNHNNESELFDDTTEDFELQSGSPQRRPVHMTQLRSTNTNNTRRDFIPNTSGGFAAKESEELINKLRAENLDWRIRYQNLKKLLDDEFFDTMSRDERSLARTNLELNEAVTKLKHENNKLHMDIDELSNGKENPATTIIQEKLDEIEQLKEKNHELNKMLTLEKKNNTTGKDEHHDLTVKLMNYEGVIKDYEEELESIMKKNSNLESMVKDLQTNNDKLHRNQALSSNLDEQVESMKEQLMEVEELKNVFEKKAAHLEVQFSEKNREYNILEEEKRAATRKIEELEGQLDNIKFAYDKDEESFVRHKQHLQEELDAKQMEIDELKRSRSFANDNQSREWEFRYEELNEKFAKVRNEIGVKDEEIFDLSNLVKRLKAELDDKAHEINILNSKKSGKLSSYEEDIERKLNQLNEIRNELEIRDEQLIQAERENRLLLSELDGSDEMATKLKNLRFDYDKYSEDKERELTKLQKIISEKNFEITQLKSKLDRVDRSVDQELHTNTISYRRRIAELENYIEDIVRGHEHTEDEKVEDIRKLLIQLKEMDEQLNRNVEIIAVYEADKVAADKVITELKSDLLELLDSNRELASLSRGDTDTTDLKRMIRDLEEQVQSRETYIANLESKHKFERPAVENLESEVKYLTNQVREKQTLIESLEKELKDASKAYDKSFTVEYLESQLEFYREEVEKVNKELKSCNKKITDLEVGKSQAESKFSNIELKNKELNDLILAKEKKLASVTNDCVRLARSTSKYMELSKSISNPQFVEFIKKENYYIRERFADMFHKYRDYKFMYNYAIDAVKNSTKLIGLEEKNANLVKLGIYPEHNHQNPKTKKLTFAGVARLVLASVRLKNRTQRQTKRRKELAEIKGDVDIGRIKFN
ncbi:hypothetical protein G210_2224 [Candida maltosa Xu316]|uniref:Centrosomin N-terminal motif 1 domain-containing protein n=1 Tax=Candida maltosa (strain Xu316) TaxID=1245528 RepID=M3IM41_CANMX|nr:hypothetical protein G210_2224 [Candida maltosa Xu316]